MVRASKYKILIVEVTPGSSRKCFIIVLINLTLEYFLIYNGQQQAKLVE